MKSILSLAIALVALFSVSTASAQQHPNFVKVNYCGNDVSIRISALTPSTDYTIVLEGYVQCSKQTPGAGDPENTFFSISRTAKTDNSGTICIDEDNLRLCPGGYNQNTSTITSATVTVYPKRGRKVSLGSETLTEQCPLTGRCGNN